MYTKGTRICTKDGRVAGNSTIIEINSEGTEYTLRDDCGDVFTVSFASLVEMFWSAPARRCWYFELNEGCVKVQGFNYSHARSKMIERHGDRWIAQHRELEDVPIEHQTILSAL